MKGEPKKETWTGTESAKVLADEELRGVVGGGQKVTKGDKILVMDFMQMETPVAAPCDGTVTVMVNATDKVATGDTLAVIA